MSIKRIFLITLLCWLPPIAWSQDVVVTSSFTGLWDQKPHESQGIDLQIVHQDDGSRMAVAFWFTYGDDRESRWFLGQGPVMGNSTRRGTLK